MPVINGVGFNRHSTPKKQKALDGLAGHLLGSVARVAQKYATDAVVLDMTCGPGEDEAGRLGSPLILARHVTQLAARGLSCRLVCVDRIPAQIERLQAIMRLRYPDLPVRYETDQRAALKGLSVDTVGLAYFDPNQYTDLDVNLLLSMRRFARLDILFTRACVAYRRMKGAGLKALSPEDYLNATGKRCRYIVQFAAWDGWSFGFADNWVKRPPDGMRWQAGKLLRVDTPEGRALLDRLSGKKEEQPCKQMTLFGSTD